LNLPESADSFKALQTDDVMTTPRAEDVLYGASNYVFLTVSATKWTGDQRYGPVAMVVKDSAWADHGWGSEHSGWYFLKRASKEIGIPLSYQSPHPQAIERAGDYFKSSIFVPKDFRLVTALWAIKKLRSLPEGVILDLASGATEPIAKKKLFDWLDKNAIGYLEGKMKRIHLADIERIEIQKKR
jgi:hypothetical protein